MKPILDWFADQGNASFALASLTALGLLGGLTAWLLKAKKERRSAAAVELQEQARVGESKKAKLVAYLSPQSLRIENIGEAEARDVNVILDGRPLNEHPAVVPKKEVREIEPRSQIEYAIALTWGVPDPADIRVTWSDDSGEPCSYRTTFTP